MRVAPRPLVGRLIVPCVILFCAIAVAGCCGTEPNPNDCGPNPNPNDCGPNPNPNPCGPSGGYGVSPVQPTFQSGGQGWR
jgi:hypothetical protein